MNRPVYSSDKLQRIGANTPNRMANDHEMVDNAGAKEVDPPRLVHTCHTDPASVLYQTPPFVPLTITAMFVPCAETATGVLVVPPVSSQLVDQALSGAKVLSTIRSSAPTTNRCIFPGESVAVL